MSRLKDLLRVAPPSTRNTQQNLLHYCTPVAHHAQQPANDTAIREHWQEFERLLAVVGPAYTTPAHEYSIIRAAASGDLAYALMAYRELARKVKDQVEKRTSAAMSPPFIFNTLTPK